MRIPCFRPIVVLSLLLPIVGCFNPPDPSTSGLGTTTTTDPVTDTSSADGMSESGGPPAQCGNGVVEEGEDCDEGAESAACNADCTTATCGDGHVNPAAGEICDDGNDDSEDGCNAMCMPGDCGDGVVVAPETCDDANQDQTDDCVACQAATCGDGFTQAGAEDCDDANDDDTDTCPSTCTTAYCGDGFVLAGSEACDDGNADDTDACISSCVEASCGDGFVQAGVEACDDADTDDDDDCPSTCQPAACGDGFVHAGVEACDDGNGNPDDGCDACSLTCGDDCWSDAGCVTDAGRCIRFTCTDGTNSATACDTCFGWQPITYGQWLMGGYCGDVTARYRAAEGTNTKCGDAPACCGDSLSCSGGDNAWHFSNGVNNYYVGPCLGCPGDTNCTYWNDIDDSSYTRITACERTLP